MSAADFQTSVRPEIPASQPQLKYARSRSVWEGKMKSRLQIRHFSHFYTGEPEHVGGDNSAPTPMEYVVASFNGCLTIVIEMVAKELGVPLEAIEMETEGAIDQRGVFGTAPVSPHFNRVINRTRVRTSAGQEALDEVRRRVMRRCPAFNLIRDAGVPIELDWVAEPTTSGSWREPSPQGAAR
ncbi:OsmC family protein [Pseudonocardia hispaniensis]|uniref:OsmC family protein n=1 Tax=Pseudonocardia hispaniensis TaxID=904933 RepID=A0ABW1J2Z2_9PSEU